MRILLPLLLSAGVAFGQVKTTPSQGVPPKNLVKSADGHITANEDPAKPENFEVRVVETGETLSQISGQALKDPKLWPQLWEQNEHIVNPHWIYPSDKILIRPVTRITDATPLPPPVPIVSPEVQAKPAPPAVPLPQVIVRPAPAQPVSPPPPQDVFVLTPPRAFPEIKSSDVYCSGFIRAEEVPTDLRVIGRHNADGSAMAAANDYIYLAKGTEHGVKAGTLYQIIRPTKKLDSPGRPSGEKNLGRHYLEVAQVRVSLAQTDFAVARVIHSCEAIEVGDLIIPFQRYDLPVISRPRQFSEFMKTTGQMRGSIVSTKDALVTFGSAFRTSGATSGVGQGSLASMRRGTAVDGMVVYVDLGRATGVRPGDVFIIYRQIRLREALFDVPDEEDSVERQMTAVGELVILKVEERAATALVIYSTDGVVLGDVVERR